MKVKLLSLLFRALWRHHLSPLMCTSGLKLSPARSEAYRTMAACSWCWSADAARACLHIVNAHMSTHTLPISGNCVQLKRGGWDGWVVAAARGGDGGPDVAGGSS